MSNVLEPQKASPFKKVFALILYWWGLIITILGFLGIIVNFAGDAPDTEKPDLFQGILGVLVFGTLPLIVGIIMKKNLKNKSIKDAYIRLERNVLEAAKKHKGRLTLSDASFELNTSMERTRELMDIFVKKNIAEPDIDEDGKVIYIFNDFVSYD